MESELKPTNLCVVDEHTVFAKRDFGSKWFRIHVAGSCLVRWISTTHIDSNHGRRLEHADHRCLLVLLSQPLPAGEGEGCMAGTTSGYHG